MDLAPRRASQRQRRTVQRPGSGVNGINYGGLLFTNPVPIAFALPPGDPGIYAIQVKSLSYGPLPFQPIAFGQHANLSSVALGAHPDLALWNAHRLAGSGLFVSYSVLRYESLSYRESMVLELGEQYLPRSRGDEPRATATGPAG